MIKGTTKVCGVIGYPVEHSMSPLLHNFFAEQLGLDLVYVPFSVPKEKVGLAVQGAEGLQLAGINVTVPHKQAVMPYLPEIDEAALAIGAVNTLVPVEHGYKGYNTDAAGLLRAMTEEKIEIQGQDCIIIGAGGAAKAAAYVLAREGAKNIYILNRNREKAEALAGELREQFQGQSICGMALEEYSVLPEAFYLAVQCTSVGMHPHVGQAAIEEPAFYERIHTGVEIIYTPMETKFMRLTAEAGGKTMNGLSMLIYQGVTAFELWNPGVRIDAESIAEAKLLLAAGLKG